MGWTFYNSSGEQLIYDAGSAIEQATQAEAEAESNVNKYVPPDLIKNSPGVAKAYCTIAADGTLQSNSYNIASSSKNSAGNYDVEITTDMANANYSANVTPEELNRYAVIQNDAGSPLAGALTLAVHKVSDQAAIDTPLHLTIHGLQV